MSTESAPVGEPAARDRPVLFCLHGLGLSSRLFAPLAAALPEFEVVALDLPGFGDSNGTATVEETVRYVLDRIRRRASSRWMIAGHNMGGRFAAIAAARVLAGEPGVFGLAGLVLLAPSPLTPEPMSEDRRAAMVRMAADGPISAADAASFVDANSGDRLPASSRTVAIEDVRGADPDAWTTWFTRGSREDWSAGLDTLPVPALVLAGADDGDLGPDAQRELTLPRFPASRLHIVEGVRHLIPLEAPGDAADAIRRFWSEHAGRGPAVPPAWAATIASSRTNRRMRALLAERALADDPGYRPRTLDASALATLRALAAAAVPQEGQGIDLAARLDAGLSGVSRDGWRSSRLPRDADAYRSALAALDGAADLDEGALAALLDEVAGGRGPGGGLEPDDLADWWEDCRVDLVQLWIGHPASMAAIGWDAFANGGDGVRIEGFQVLAAGRRELWEPEGIDRAT